LESDQRLGMSFGPGLGGAQFSEGGLVEVRPASRPYQRVARKTLGWITSVLPVIQERTAIGRDRRRQADFEGLISENAVSGQLQAPRMILIE
jgi:hypothetical protein